MDTSSAGAACPNQVSKKTVDRETVALRDRWEEARPLLLARLALGTAGGLFALAALAGALDIGGRPTVLLLAAFLAVELAVVPT